MTAGAPITTRALKVYGAHAVYLSGAVGQRRAIVAAQSKAAAARALGVSQYYAKSYVTETGNAEEIAQALTEPGVVFHHHIDDRSGGWER